MLPRISDSNYVPLSATQAPVTGLTDILTPVNLIPNSDFSRSGGYAATQTYNEIVADWTTLNYAVSLNTYFQVESGVDKITNVTITRSANKINVKATLGTFDTSAHQNGPILRLRIIGPRYSANRPYTLHCVIKDNLHPENSKIYVNPGGTLQLIYNNNDTTIIKGLGTENDYYMKIAFTNYSSGDSIDFDYIEGAIYEGEFKNPPITASLDVKRTNQFVLTDLTNFNVFANRYKTLTTARIAVTSGWVRLLQFKCIDSGINNLYYEMIMGKSFNYGKPCLNVFKIWLLVGGTDVQNQVAIDAEQSFLNGQATYNYNFTKYRITKSSADSIVFYLEGYVGTQINDVYTIMIKYGGVGNYINLDPLNRASAYYTSFLPIIPDTYTINTNDTVIAPGEFIPRRFGANFAS